MPKMLKLYKNKEKAKKKRYNDRKKNYMKGRFGSRRKTPFTKFEQDIIILHTLPDRELANRFNTSVNGLQSLRWRIKKNYKGLYGGTK